jgi:RsiW-degrading membrane proteinase PrsW (M82 family)
MILSLFVAIALVEELMKFFAVRFTILHEEEFDEPIDAMLYLIIAALGFAAVENAFTVSGSQVQKQGFFGEGGVLLILGARSLSATLLHTLSSGIVGYALARTFFSQKPKRRILTLGLLIATLIHGTYNGIVGGIFVSRNAPSPFANVAILLIVTALALLLMLRHLRKLSAAHRWQNEGDHAQEVDLVVR